MNAKLMTVSAVALALGFASQARAQNMPEQVEPKPLPAPAKALELVAGTGYTQGFGNFVSGTNIQDVIRAGIGVDAAITYRATPYFSFGVSGQYNEFNAERAASARGFTAGLQAVVHILPYSRVDPFFNIGTGYRGLWENPNVAGADNLATHGLELAKLQFGVDFRASQDVAIAPIIGTSLSLPLWQSVGNQSATNISDPRVGLYVFAGAQARFDITMTHEVPARPAVQQTTVTSTQVYTPPPPQPQPEAKPPEQPPPETMKNVCPSINVSEEIMSACGLEETDVNTAPKFDFNKSDLLPKDLEVLQKIAECFDTGALKGKAMLLVGRADPRGTVAYNDRLGMRRANNVATFLEQHNIPSNRVERVTRGERDARGTNEETWAIDRRVDIHVSH